MNVFKIYKKNFFIADDLHVFYFRISENSINVYVGNCDGVMTYVLRTTLPARLMSNQI